MIEPRMEGQPQWFDLFTQMPAYLFPPSFALANDRDACQRELRFSPQALPVNHEPVAIASTEWILG